MNFEFDLGWIFLEEINSCKGDVKKQLIREFNELKYSWYRNNKKDVNKRFRKLKKKLENVNKLVQEDRRKKLNIINSV